eukprot:6550601-Pyramimonas_sp.AAC.1
MQLCSEQYQGSKVLHFVGGDAQTELEPNLLGFTGEGLEEVWTRTEAKHHEGRRDMLVRSLNHWGLCAANTYGVRQVTHRPRSTSSYSRVLDYVFVPTQFAGTEVARTNCSCECMVEFVDPTQDRASRCSDHAKVGVRIKHTSVRKPFVRPRPPRLIKRAPEDYESAKVFSALADVQMQQHVSQQGDINIQTAGEMLVSAATMRRHTKGRADTKPIKKPDHLVDVEAELRRGVFGERRKQLLRRQKPLRRKFR